METERPDPDVQKRPRASILAYVSLYCGIIALILSFAEALAFYVYIESGGLNTTVATVWSHLFLGRVIPMITFIFVAVSLVLIVFRKPRLIGLLLAIAAQGIFLYSISGFSFDTERTSSFRYFAYNQKRLRDIEWLARAIQEYSQEHDGQFPPLTNWCDVLVDFDPNVSDSLSIFRFEIRKGLSRYALNENLTGMRLPHISNDVVLLFETSPGKNPVGGRDLITAEQHYGRGCIVLFGDLHLGFVRAEDFNDLRWEP